jgi:hypothetical protein
MLRFPVFAALHVRTVQATDITARRKSKPSPAVRLPRGVNRASGRG